ncbi:DUF1524 domain-containing protein [Pseudarthrobacter sp. NPDC058119]|uniref:GmrSD restriction endonuclease domain-containing protein n=1 Tax=Pseudarthrobacter sp. NPDC058119 TaxID=3346348 RepID=UPI0036DC898A
MSDYETLLGFVPSAPAPRPPRKPRLSTFIVAGLTGLFMLFAALSGGIGGALIILGISAALTGLYVILTGRRSWAWLPAKRKAGAVAIAAALALFIGGAAALPRVAGADLEAASSESTAKAAPPKAGPTATATASPSAAPTATPTDTGEPLDPEDPSVLAAGVTAAAPNAQPAYASKALDVLAALPIKGRAPKTGYDRAQFGQAWADVDRNGCDTRNDILKRDLTGVSYTNSVPCKVQSGTLADPYTGKTISFVRGSATSSAVQIDHVVALSDAWQKGAQQLTAEQRTAFANDPLNLQATDGPTNQQKGDGDAATWLPPNKGFRCEYVARQVSVKATYGLWVTQAEHDAIARILGDCAGQLAPTNQQAPAPAPAPAAVAPVPGPAPASPAPAPAAVAPVPVAPAPVVQAPAAPGPAAAYYANCAAARAAGAAPLYAGQAGYRPALDRDSDGVACE